MRVCSPPATFSVSRAAYVLAALLGKIVSSVRRLFSPSVDWRGGRVASQPASTFQAEFSVRGYRVSRSPERLRNSWAGRAQSVRSTSIATSIHLRFHMKSQDSKNSGRRSSRGPRRSSRPRTESRATKPAARLSLWEKLRSFFRRGPKSKNGALSKSKSNGGAAPYSKTSYRPEVVEVTSAKLYVGNLSFDATENDLQDLFKGVGTVSSAEIVTHRQTERSKGFAFVTMSSIDEARRAVQELHDQAFLGRKLVISGAKTGSGEPNYRG
jgi:hypothetical protein